MKNLLSTLVMLILGWNCWAQNTGINYQAVILNPNPVEIPGTFIQNQVLVQSKVTIRFTIKTGNTVDFEETHATKTDDFGLVNLTIGTGEAQVSNALHRQWNAIVWNAQVKSLVVAVKFENSANFLEVSNQTFNYSPYALYAASVEYTNVQNAPKKLSHFENDPGYLIKQDLKPLEDKMAANEKETAKQFVLVETQRISLEKRLESQEIQIGTQATGLLAANKTSEAIQSQVTQNFNTLSSQLNDQRAQTTNQFNSLGGSFESLSNKSTATDLGSGNPSNQAYPSQQAVKTYVDQAISQVVVSGAPDATTLAPGKVQLAGDLGGTATNPTVPGLAQKEALTNKTVDLTADGASDIKYPSAKAVKIYVDQATLGTALAADLNAKADKNSPIFTGIPQLPSTTMAITQSNGTNSTQIATTAFVQNSIAALSVNDASSSAKGIIQLGGDLGGTASAPLVPGLAGKEVSSNKSNDINADALSITKYPSVKMIKDYVDTQVTNGSVSDASTSIKGIVRLAGDLGGTSASPSINSDAITTIKIQNGAVTDAKIDQVSGSKVTGNILGNAANVTGIVSASNGGSGVAGTLTGYLIGNGTSAFTASSTIPVAHVTGAELVANKSTATDLGNSTPSDTYYSSQKAVKTYVDAAVSNSVGGATLTALDLKENAANKSDATLGTSTTLFPTQNAVKTYVDGKLGASNYITFSNLPLLANGTVLGNFSGSTASPSALNTTGSGNLVRASNATITSPVLNGTITGSAVLSVANGGLGTNTMSAGYVKAGNPFFSISAIPVSDVSGAVQKVNGITPDGSGNVAILYGRTYTGIYNGGTFTAVSSPTNSDIYIVSADPTNSNNGRTFIYDGASWNEISTDQAALDARYVRLSGGVMGGNLSFGIGKKVILQDAPSADTDAVNKAYVDNTVSTGGTPDASATTSGKIKLAGDITGTASSPSIAANAISTLKIADGAVTDAKISGILSASKGGTGIDNTGKSITLGGNLVLNGAYATNLSVSATTTLNLPATGTLSTLAGTEDLTNKSVNGVRPSSLGTGFNLVGGTISKTLTVGNDASIIGSNTGDQTITLSGDLTGSGTGAISTTLANSGVVSGSFGSASAIPVITVDTKGRITSISTQSVTATNPSGTTLTDGKIWIGNGSNVAAAQALSGDISLSNAGVVAIGTGKITNGMLAGSIDLPTKVTGILPVANGGTGLSSLTNRGILIGNGNSNLTTLSGTTAGDLVSYSGSAWVASQPIAADATTGGILTTGTQTIAGAKTFASLTSSGNSSVGGNLVVTGTQTNSGLTASKVIFTDASKVLTSTGTVGVAQGGTGATTLTSAALLVGAGTSAVTAISPGSDGQVLISRSGVWAAENASPAVTLGSVNASSTAKALTITAGGEISLSPADGTNPGIMTTGTQTIAGAKTFASLTSSGNSSIGGNLVVTGSQTNNALTASKVIFTDASKVLTSTGTVGVAQGGTGAATLSAGSLLVGNGTGAVTSLAPSTAGYVLKVVGSTWTVSAPDTDESDQFFATTNQLTFTLTQTPVSHSKIQMFINGIRIDKDAYSVNARIVTYTPANNSAFELAAGDRIQFDYEY